MTKAEDLGIRVSHVGIATASDEDYENATKLLSTMLGTEVMETPVSRMIGDQIELMKPTQDSRNHIAVHVDDMPAAERHFTNLGFKIDESRRRLAEDGSGATHLVYLEGTIAGFEVHLTTD